LAHAAPKVIRSIGPVSPQTPIRRAYRREITATESRGCKSLAAKQPETPYSFRNAQWLCVKLDQVSMAVYPRIRSPVQRNVCGSAFDPTAADTRDGVGRERQRIAHVGRLARAIPEYDGFRARDAHCTALGAVCVRATRRAARRRIDGGRPPRGRMVGKSTRGLTKVIPIRSRVHGPTSAMRDPRYPQASEILCRVSKQAPSRVATPDCYVPAAFCRSWRE
jgi:hypothetical protein